MIIIFDTNVWKSELYLQSAPSAAVRFFLKKKKARVALPEVVRLEVEKHLMEDIKKIRSRMLEDHRRLLGYFGKLKELVLPNDAELEELSSKLFSNVGVEIVDIPFSLTSARNSFLKTINKEAPSDQGQEFKDGLIWADCVALLESDHVWLISKDKAFYDDRNIESGLAKSLAVEIKNSKYKLSLLPKLSDLLAEIASDAIIDQTPLIKRAFDERQEEITRMLKSQNYSLGRIRDFQRTVFATEQPSKVFLEFKIEFDCPNDDQHRPPAILTLSGDTMYDIDSHELERFRQYSPALRYQQPDGAMKELQGVTIFGEPLVIGHRDVEHTIRYRLE
jgi:hypothetical protein